MTSPPRHPVRWARACASVLLLALAGTGARAEPVTPAPQAAPERALLATYRRLAGQLERSSFGRPLLLDSAETPDGLQGDIHAVVDHSLAELHAALTGPAHWCELLSLHINNRRCRVDKAQQGEGDMLTLSVVRRYDMPVEDAFELPFVYRVASATPDHLAVDMAAGTGPLGTSNYHVVLEAVALGEHKAFVHFSYAYDHNTVVRLATQAYLATFGSEKVGFTVVGREPDGQPTYIAGLRGLVERNAMRYFLRSMPTWPAPGRCRSASSAGRRTGSSRSRSTRGNCTRWTSRPISRSSAPTVSATALRAERWRRTPGVRRRAAAAGAGWPWPCAPRPTVANGTTGGWPRAACARATAGRSASSGSRPARAPPPAAASREMLGEMPAGREDQVGAGQQVRRHREVGHRDGGIARHALGRQVSLDHAALRLAVQQGHYVRSLQVVDQLHAAAGRMVAVDQADDLVLHQQGGAQMLGRLRPVADHHVELAFGEAAS